MVACETVARLQSCILLALAAYADYTTSDNHYGGAQNAVAFPLTAAVITTVYFAVLPMWRAAVEQRRREAAADAVTQSAANLHVSPDLSGNPSFSLSSVRKSGKADHAVEHTTGSVVSPLTEKLSTV